ncbi:hypothetical protein [Moorena sp. SIO1G6]|nr:hypothetical protein [Moorena sp. SIO1G6]
MQRIPIPYSLFPIPSSLFSLQVIRCSGDPLFPKIPKFCTS